MAGTNQASRSQSGFERLNKKQTDGEEKDNVSTSPGPTAAQGCFAHNPGCQTDRTLMSQIVTNRQKVVNAETILEADIGS
jgi:hypothetical protein